MITLPDLTEQDCQQIAEILKRRANDIATFKYDLEKKTSQKFDELPGSVEMAMSREMARLRKLADRVNPRKPEPEEDEE